MPTKKIFLIIFWFSVAALVLWHITSDLGELSDIEKQLLLIRRSIAYATVFLAYIAWRVTPE